MSRFDLWSRYVARSSQPILIGPWRSEVGFETLYWLPFLAAWRKRYGIAKDRLVAISRGGAGIWYDAAHSVDLYDYTTVAKVRQSMLKDATQSGSIKQQRLTEWERLLLPVIAHDLGMRRYHVLHPSVMYQQLTPWWDGSMGMADLLPQLAFTPVPVPFPPLALPLPERYVAVGFYARHTWPLAEDLRLWTATLVDTIAKHIPVVLLESNLHADDHLPFPLTGPNILSTKDHVTPQTNLAVQSAVIAKAQAFIGTYGGTMQLAVRLGKPAVGFYQKFEGTAYAHKHLTEWLGVQQHHPVWIGTQDDARFAREALLVG